MLHLLNRLHTKLQGELGSSWSQSIKPRDDDDTENGCKAVAMASSEATLTTPAASRYASRYMNGLNGTSGKGRRNLPGFAHTTDRRRILTQPGLCFLVGKAGSRGRARALIMPLTTPSICQLSFNTKRYSFRLLWGRSEQPNVMAVISCIFRSAVENGGVECVEYALETMQSQLSHTWGAASFGTARYVRPPKTQVAIIHRHRHHVLTATSFQPCLSNGLMSTRAFPPKVSLERGNSVNLGKLTRIDRRARAILLFLQPGEKSEEQVVRPNLAISPSRPRSTRALSSIFSGYFAESPAHWQTRTIDGSGRTNWVLFLPDFTCNIVPID